MTKNEKIGVAMKFNTNAEKWSEEKAVEFMEKAVELSKSKEYDFIGEIAKDLDSYKDVFFYLSDKYPSIKRYVKIMRNNCEANCFNNIKKENINVGAGIMNLKSNHGWTDRVQQDLTTQGDKIESPQIIVNSVALPDKLQGLMDDLSNE